MKFKNIILPLLIVILLIAGIFLLIRGFNGEDSWIKDSRGVYIKHGNPSSTPDYVLEQQEAINCTLEKFDNFSEEKNSQLLGNLRGLCS